MDIVGFGSIANLINTAITRIWPDATEGEKAKLELLKMELGAVWENAAEQIKVNAVEAQHQSIFVSGWRPFIGWVCGIAMSYKFIVAPLMLFFAALGGHNLQLPTLDFTEMLTVLFGLLGLGAMRSYEKVKGVTNAKG